MAKTRGKTQPEQDDALFKERKPRQRKQKTTAQVVETPPPAPVGEPYVMPKERQEAIDVWLSTPVALCPYCGVDVYPTDSRKLDQKDRLAHMACVPPPFEFPPLVKRFKDHEVLYLDREYGIFRAGYYIGKLYQCGPGNLYGRFGSFGLDEKQAIEDLGIETIQIWNRHEAYQIKMDMFQEKGEPLQTPPGLRWLVGLEHFERAERG